MIAFVVIFHVLIPCSMIQTFRRPCMLFNLCSGDSANSWMKSLWRNSLYTDCLHWKTKNVFLQSAAGYTFIFLLWSNKLLILIQNLMELKRIGWPILCWILFNRTFPAFPYLTSRYTIIDLALSIYFWSVNELYFWKYPDILEEIKVRNFSKRVPGQLLKC